MPMNMLNALLGAQPKATDQPVAHQGRNEHGAPDDSGFTDALTAEQSGSGEGRNGDASASMTDDSASGPAVSPGISNDMPEPGYPSSSIVMEDPSESLPDLGTGDDGDVPAVNAEVAELLGSSIGDTGNAATARRTSASASERAGTVHVRVMPAGRNGAVLAEDTDSMGEASVEDSADDLSGQAARRSGAVTPLGTSESTDTERPMGGGREPNAPELTSLAQDGDGGDRGASTETSQSTPREPRERSSSDVRFTSPVLVESTSTDDVKPDASPEDNVVLPPGPKLERARSSSEGRSGEPSLPVGTAGPAGNDPETPAALETTVKPASSPTATSTQSQSSGSGTSSNATLVLTAAQQTAPTGATGVNATAVDAAAFREAVIMRPDASMIQQIISAASSRTSAGTVEVFLDPPELGKIEISIDLGDQGLRATLSAERQTTQDMIRRNLGDLAQTFEDAGFSDIDLGFSDRHDGSDSGDADAFSSSVGDAELPETRSRGVTLNLISGSTMDLRL